MNKRHFAISQEVIKVYPDFAVCFLMLSGVNDYLSNQERQESEQEMVQFVYAVHNNLEEIFGHRDNAAYQQFYESMDLNLKKISMPIKQVARVYRNKTYKSIHQIIDICMRIEYETLISFQVYDSDSLGLKLKYFFAREKYLFNSSKNNYNHLKPKEVILADERGLIHSPLYGNSRRTLITPTTKNILIRIMKIPGIPLTRLEQARTKLLSATLCPTQSVTLSKSDPQGVMEV